MGRVQVTSAVLAFMALRVLASGVDSESTSLRGVEARPASQPQPNLQGPERPAQVGFLAKQPSPPADVTTAEAEWSLIAELAGNVSVDRLRELEAALRPTYAALPKGDAGYLGHQAVRYALHRLLLQRHGWFIVGLEPTDEVLPPYLHGEWVPEYLQGVLEQRLGGRGLDLHEIAALAATLEDLVSKESAKRMDSVYELLRMSPAARLDGAEADRLLETYMMFYLDGGNFSDPGKDLDLERAVFKAEYASWDSAASWMQEIKSHHLGRNGDARLGRADMVSVASELGERFGAFNDGECRGLKREMMLMETRPARIPILDFYKKGLISHWEFNEKAEYLRAIGALDESDEVHPSVILPNYLGSRTNCLTASTLYSVCCRNECEDLMGHLEREIAGPSAPPQQILELVAALPSDTTNASRVLPDLLVQRLHQIAARHGGRVPVHGRLFAQWMHHAYPHECPFPHEGGVNPLTPDEWMREAGEGAARVSEEEVRQLLGSCANTGADGAPCSGGASGPEAEPAELPWSDAEVLLVSGPAQLGAPPAWVVAAKASLLVMLLPLLSLYSSRSSGSDGRVSSEQDAKLEDFDDFEEDGLARKPTGGSHRWQHCKVLLGIVVVGGVLELLGVLDRFSFSCTLVGGLLLNVAVPLLLRRSAVQGLKKAKCCV